jgi:hypothetical protein
VKGPTGAGVEPGIEEPAVNELAPAPLPFAQSAESDGGPAAVDLAAEPVERPARVRTASGAEVVIHPETDRLVIHVSEGLPEVELQLTPRGLVVRTPGPSLAFEAPEHLRLAAPTVEIAATQLVVGAREAAVTTRGDLRLRGARIFLN